MPDPTPAYADWHKVTIELETDDNRKLHDLVRFVLGLQGVLSPSISIRHTVYWSETLDRKSNPNENA